MCAWREEFRVHRARVVELGHPADQNADQRRRKPPDRGVPQIRDRVQRKNLRDSANHKGQFIIN